MNFLIYWLGRAFIGFIQALPLTWVARFGRVMGGLAFYLDGRHRRVALKNLTLCFSREKSPEEIRAIARENFKRLGESYLSAIKTSAMSMEQLRPHVEYIGTEKLFPPHRVVNAGGHFGNFELYARFKDLAPGYQLAATYRALNQPALNRLLTTLRDRSGVHFFERLTQGGALRTFMNQPAAILSLQIDQHGGDKGMRLPFLGHECSTSPSPAVFALRYQCAFYAAACFRVGLAKWRIELGEQIPTHDASGQPRDVVDLIRDVLRIQEGHVRRDPANWFWVHRRWKPGGRPPHTTKTHED